jgi:hypothetical protein
MLTKEFESLSIEELFDRMPSTFKYASYLDCYWELSKVRLKQDRYFIIIYDEHPYRIIHKLEGTNIKSVVISALEWIESFAY